jgi:hypothetical protein
MANDRIDCSLLGSEVSIPDKDRVADRHPGIELAYESVT